MLPLAAATASTAERLKNLPPEVWLKLAAGVAGLVLLVVLLRKVAQMNRVVLTVLVALGLCFLGINWIYHRNEPRWATPVVELLAGFFPSKGPSR